MLIHYFADDDYKRVIDLIGWNCITFHGLEERDDWYDILTYSSEIIAQTFAVFSSVSEKNLESVLRGCDAITITRGNNKDICYDSIALLRNASKTIPLSIGMDLSKASIPSVQETLADLETDNRIKGIRLILTRLDESIYAYDMENVFYDDEYPFIFQNVIYPCRTCLDGVSLKDVKDFDEDILKSSVFKEYREKLRQKYCTE